MQGDPLVITCLHAQLKNGLTAINLYFVHCRMFKHWGFQRMAKKEYEESIGETLPEALACDLKSEQGAQATVKAGVAQCEASRDDVSRDLFQHILEDTEEHIDFLETQLELIDMVGVHNYRQTQISA